MFSSRRFGKRSLSELRESGALRLPQRGVRQRDGLTRHIGARLVLGVAGCQPAPSRNGNRLPKSHAATPRRRSNRAVQDASTSQHDQAASELNALLSRQRRFLAHVSHEMRGPVGGISQLTSILMSSPLTEQQRRYASHVKYAADTLMGLLNDILESARIEAGKFQLHEEPFGLRMLIDRAAENAAILARNKSVALRVRVDERVPATLLGDPLRVGQVIANLLGNALKFTCEGEVSISADLVETLANGRVLVHIDVRDTGYGISPESQKLLFTEFGQPSDGRLHQAQGTGFGLALCKQLVELMGGQIGVESRKNTGSRFFIDLPFAMPGAAPVFVDPIDAFA